MDFEHIRPVISGLAGGLVVYWLARAGRRSAVRIGERRHLQFSLAIRIGTALFACAMPLILYAAANARPDQRIIAFIVSGAMAAGSCYMVYAGFFTSISYDEQHLHYRSPLAGELSIPWAQVEETGWSSWMQCHYIKGASTGRIWVSYMLIGFNELFEFMEHKHIELYGEETPGDE